MQYTKSPRDLSLLTALLSVLALAALAPAEARRNEVLSHYPTREQLQRGIDEAKRVDGESFERAREDFGNAIRFSLNPNGPPWPRKPVGIPIIAPRPTLYALRTPADWESDFKLADEISPGSEWAAFYREHMDQATIDDSVPVLKQVLTDVVLNAWDDWVRWEDDKLAKLREEFPELHRVYAMRELGRLKVEDATGLLLSVFVDPGAPGYVWNEALGALDKLASKMDQVEFVVQRAFSEPNFVVRERLQSRITTLSARVRREGPPDARCKTFWEKYLESDVPMLQFEARKVHALPVPGPLERLFAQDRWIVENALDPKRRERTAEHIRIRERSNAFSEK